MGGRLSGFGAIRLRALWLVWLAALVQAAQYYVKGVRSFIEQRVGVSMLAIVFAFTLVWLAVNLRHRLVAIRIAGVVIALGAASNGLAIALNGRMPYEPAVAAAVGLRPGLTTPKNEPADANTRLPFLGDTIPIAPLHKVISPGDVLISGGACAVVVLAMCRHRRGQPVPSQTEGGES
ncbi:DUF5317 domain-containing protein [Micromonospora yasonensis]|uniref:DUF5317 domain-containing protein n=1 Tax=Micromonospora yasonensis TaxID=1128667 RepID=UPI00223015D6|nr:DUF5317 domain-containing protein [Micromonospora yasonensis]MCW3841856.1 DUF5317 domain-containing protein [Micromonospora yasonensis]